MRKIREMINHDFHDGSSRKYTISIMECSYEIIDPNFTIQNMTKIGHFLYLYTRYDKWNMILS